MRARFTLSTYCDYFHRMSSAANTRTQRLSLPRREFARSGCQKNSREWDATFTSSACILSYNKFLRFKQNKDFHNAGECNFYQSFCCCKQRLVISF